MGVENAERRKKKENTREIVGEVKGRKTGRLMKSIKDKKRAGDYSNCFRD